MEVRLRRFGKVEKIGVLMLNIAASFLLFFSISILFLVPGDPTGKSSYLAERGGYGFGALLICVAMLLLTGWLRKQGTAKSLGGQEAFLALLCAFAGVVTVFVIAMIAQQFRK
jgi:uncharacterized membrane protein